MTVTYPPRRSAQVHGVHHLHVLHSSLPFVKEKPDLDRSHSGENRYLRATEIVARGPRPRSVLSSRYHPGHGEGEPGSRWGLGVYWQEETSGMGLSSQGPRQGLRGCGT